jgi:hypothetical protein
VAIIMNEDRDHISRRWHHQPAHLFHPNSTYFLTAATLHKEH